MPASVLAADPPGSHFPVKPVGVLGLDQRHRPLVEGEAFEQDRVGLGNDVDNRIADADNVERRVGHGKDS